MAKNSYKTVNLKVSPEEKEALRKKASSLNTSMTQLILKSTLQNDYTAVKKQLIKLQKELKEVQKENASLLDKQAHHATALDQLNKRLLEKDQAIQVLNNHIDQLTNDKKILNNQLAVKDKQIDNAQSLHLLAIKDRNTLQEQLDYIESDNTASKDHKKETGFFSWFRRNQ